MKLVVPRLVLVALFAVAGCSDSDGKGGGGNGGSPPGSGGSGGSGGGAGGTPGGGGSGGTTTGGSGGGATGGTGGSATGGAGGTATGGAGGAAGADAGRDGSGGSAGDASAPGSDGGGSASDAASDARASDAGPVNLEGWIPPYEGPPVGPEVKMDCPDDPTAGFTEYKDNFRVEHPYDLPVTARFSIEGGIYNFWVMRGDKRHNPTSTASNPRTEARYQQNFRTGIRLFNADIYWDRSVTNGTVVMQVHTTTTGIGPVYLVANGSNVPPITGSRVPGGLFDRWINLKVEINSATTGSRYWVNNCLVATKGSGTRGDGNNYFKVGVYHCDSGTCRARVKNVKLYMKP